MASSYWKICILSLLLKFGPITTQKIYYPGGDAAARELYLTEKELKTRLDAFGLKIEKARGYPKGTPQYEEKLRLLNNADKLRNMMYKEALYSIPGRLNLKYKNREIMAPSPSKCYKDLCNNDRKCAASFNNETKRCLGWMLNSQLIFWDQLMQILLPDRTAKEWETVMLQPEIEVPAPRRYWLFDRVMKGKDLGQFMEEPSDFKFVHNLEYTDWKLPNGKDSGLHFMLAPPVNKKMKYNIRLRSKKIIQDTHGAVMRLLVQDDYFNFSLPFTISMWIKSNGYSYQRIFNGYPDGAPFFGCWGSKLCNDFRYMPDNTTIYQSKRNSSFLNTWTHIAIRHHHGENISFLINGKNHFFDTHVQPGVVIRKHPEFLQLWNWEYSDNNFRGAMACLMMFQRFLESYEIKHIMNNCP